MTLSATSKSAWYSPTTTPLYDTLVSRSLSAFNPRGDQLDLHRPLIDLFQEPVPQNRMHLERGPHNLLGNLTMLQSHDLLPPQLERVPD